VVFFGLATVQTKELSGLVWMGFVLAWRKQNRLSVFFNYHSLQLRGNRLARGNEITLASRMRATQLLGGSLSITSLNLFGMGRTATSITVLSRRGKQFVQLRLLLVGCVQTSVTVRRSPRLTAVQFALLVGCRPARRARDGKDEFCNPFGVHSLSCDSKQN